MKFYELDGALQDAVAAADSPVRLKIEIDFGGHFETVFEQDIINAIFYGLKEVAGGVSARGELDIDNSCGFFSSCGGRLHGAQVKVSFSMGEGLPYFQRFVMYIDGNGVQEMRGSGRKRVVHIGLCDFSYVLRKTNEARDWTAPVVFAYSPVCDKTQPDKSLFHRIARRAGLSVEDIDCATIPVMLPYVKLRRNIWLELSGMAFAFRCHLECPVEKPLVFAHSPYQLEPLAANDCSYTFTGDTLYFFQKKAMAGQYRNSVRLKINMPVALEKQEIWRYDVPPVLYDEFLQAHYPFKYPLVRDIEAGKIEARYRVKDIDGTERNVVYADLIDSREEAENRLEYDGGGFGYSYYDISTFHDRAIVTLAKEHDGDLYKACIHGRPIVLDLNRSCFMTDSEAVAASGSAVLNVSGSYFSEFPVPRGNVAVPHYEDWVIRELEERLQERRELTIKTHRAVFHARVGALVHVKTGNEELAGRISAFSFRYRRNRAFSASFRLTEQPV